MRIDVLFWDCSFVHLMSNLKIVVPLFRNKRNEKKKEKNDEKKRKERKEVGFEHCVRIEFQSVGVWNCFHA